MRSDEQTILSTSLYNRPELPEDASELERDLLGQMDTRGPLPPSPRLKCRRTGTMYIWTPDLAALGEDAFINCDEAGNDDPNAWRNRYPKGMNVQMELMQDFRGGSPPETPASPPRADITLRPPEAEKPALVSERSGEASSQRRGKGPGKGGGKKQKPEPPKITFDTALGLPPGQAAAFGVEPVAPVPELDDFEKALAGQTAFDEALRHAAQ